MTRRRTGSTARCATLLLPLLAAGCGWLSGSGGNSAATADANKPAGTANLAAVPTPLPSSLSPAPMMGGTPSQDVTQRAGSYDLSQSSEILSSSGIDPDALVALRDRLNSVPASRVCAAAGPGGAGILNSMRNGGCQASDVRYEGGHVTAHLACTFSGAPAQGDLNALVTETSTMAQATFTIQGPGRSVRYRQTITYTRAGDCDDAAQPADGGSGGQGDDGK